MRLGAARTALVAMAAAVVLLIIGSSSNADTAQYRLDDAPIAVYSRASNGDPIYEMFVRLNRQVPRTSSGSPLAGATLERFGPNLPRATRSRGWGFTTLGRRTRRCYSQTLINFLVPGAELPERLRNPRPGLRVSVRAYIRGIDEPLTRAVRLERRRSGGATQYARRLGCVRR